jgi:Family of unknown function (DUF5989)
MGKSFTSLAEPSTPFAFGEGVMGFFRATGDRFGIARELFGFFWHGKRWWMMPILITLAVFAILLIIAQSSAIAPFIYSFF